MKRIIHHVKHHVKKHSKAVHKHLKKHHHKYIFGAISGALIYKTLALIITTAAVTPIGHSFASGTEFIYTGEVLTGTFTINNNEQTTTGLDVILNNQITGATHMRFGNTESDRNIAVWDIYSSNVNWTLDDNGTGTKTVYAQFSGYNISGENIILDLTDTIEYIIQDNDTNSDTIYTGDDTTQDSTGFISDTTPDLFDFTDITNASLNTEYYSNIKTISGINTGSEVSISTGSYKINSGDRYTSSGTINSGDTVQVKLLSSNNYETEKTLILSIGDLDITWSIITTGETIIENNTGTTDDGTSDNEGTDTGDDSLNNDSFLDGICNSNDIIMLNPLSGARLKGEFNISWKYKNTDCNNDTFTVKLRDANTQYITLGSVDIPSQTNEGSTGGLIFDSSMLYSGFYNIYSGTDLSGNNILIYTGQYTGTNTRFFSGHKIVITNTNNEIIYEGEEFTIDNEKPELNGINIEVINENNNYVGLDGTINLTFSSSEELSGIQVTILGVYAILESKEDNNYKYTLDLSPDNTAGNIIYNIEFEDIAGNTGYLEGSNSIYFDNKSPFINNLEFTNNSDIVSLILSTDEDSKIEFAYNISGSSIGGTFEDDYTFSHNHIFTGIEKNKTYNYTVSIYDSVHNTIYIGGYFILSGDNIIYDYEVIDSDDMIVDTGFESPQEEENTENSSGVVISTSPANTFKSEIDRFKACKETLTDMSSLEIPVRKYKARLQMPEFEKSYVKKLVSAFSIVVFQRIADAGLDEEQINDLTKEFNNFLVILKLVRDDDNACEQNLSNYYMSKFRKSLIEYGLVK